MKNFVMHFAVFSALCAPVIAQPALARTVDVDTQKPGAFATVGAALAALGTEGGTVRIAPGTYREKLTVAADGVTLLGMGRDPRAVVLVYGDSAMTTGSTFRSATLSVTGARFHLDNLTVANDWASDPAHKPSQAVAVSLTGDRAVVSRARILGHQDTLFVNNGSGNKPTRAYFEDCHIAGHVDFVFGNAKAFFRGCELHGEAHGSVKYTAQSRASADQDSGFVFEDCRFTADPEARNVSFGRPWRDYATVVLLEPRIEATIAPGGFSEWTPNVTTRLPTTFYAIHAPTGPGASTLTLVPEAHRLDAAGAARYRLAAFFGGDIAWIGKPRKTQPRP